MKFSKRLISATRHATRNLIEFVWQQQSLVIFRILPEELVAVSAESPNATFACASMPDVGSTIGGVRQLPKNLRDELQTSRPDQRLHLVLIDDRVASWGFSVCPRGTWPLSETRSTLDVEDDAVLLFAFETLTEYRGRRLYPGLLSRILADRFREGATAAYIWCAKGNRASYASIKRVGFKEIACHHYRRVLGISFLRT